MHCVDRSFAGVEGDFAMFEEWYSLKNFAPDLHVLLVQETAGMKGADYQRPPYPATWARMHGRGRAFYTSMGHRADVWESPVFQSVLSVGLRWATRQVDFDVTANLKQATPRAEEMPPPPR
jgi:type 1 glutamine amidotransferase